MAEPTSSTPRPRSTASLVTAATDETDNLRDVLLAYNGLEKLIAPQATADNPELPLHRGELGALLRVLNDEMDRRIESVDAAIGAVRDALTLSP